jgi:NADH-quinone oxidoreductase subunit A
MQASLGPFALYLAAAALVAAGMVGASWFLGPRHRETATGDPYESGVRVTGPARVRFAAHYYLVAMFFVIFDLEAVFLFAWAIGARELGLAAYVEILVFVGVLVLAWAYLWRVGALDWGPRRTARTASFGVPHAAGTSPGGRAPRP